MRIAIQAADLDAERIDGTRVYIRQLLNRFGDIAPHDDFLIYHKNTFHPELQPSTKVNYQVIQKSFPLAWTQTCFAFDLWKQRADRLWMPIQSLPLVRRRDMKTVVTIHDLAFLYFPDHFPFRDRLKLRVFADWAIQRSDRIIAISHNTKQDILRFYPKTPSDKIRVIHHGFDTDFAKGHLPDSGVAEPLPIEAEPKKYLLYVGALQPRKNLPTLIRAYGELRRRGRDDIKLVLAGERAWLWNDIFEEAKKSAYASDILFPGKLPFAQVQTLMCNASLFVYPSLYEGFGLPVLEGFASDVPVVCSNNSSLPEVGGEAATYFPANDPISLADTMSRLLDDSQLRERSIAAGREQLKKFSWDECARQTLEYIRS